MGRETSGRVGDDGEETGNGKRSEINTAKLPKLKITPFKGTASDWVRFENIFLSQVDRKPISAEEKFGYLLEMVNSKVRDRLSNLKPSATKLRGPG